MFIDIVFFILLALGIFKGYSKGLIKGLLSYISVIIAFTAAVKLSAMVATYIGVIHTISDKWLPFISFIAVFIAVLLIIRWIGSLIDFSVKQLYLGGANRLGGIFLYTGIYISVWSIILFYLNIMHLIPPKTIESAIRYHVSREIGSSAISSIKFIFPFLKSAFLSLETFFTIKSI